MRRANFSIGKFLPVAAMANTAGFFQSFRFHSAGAGNDRNELAELARIPHREWRSKGLDPVRFVQTINERKFYRGDGGQLLAFLKKCCDMLIKSDMHELTPSQKKAVEGYVSGIRLTFGSYFRRHSDHIPYGGPDWEGDIANVMAAGRNILGIFAAEKTKGCTVEMVEVIDRLFTYVLSMDLKDSAPAAKGPAGNFRG